MPNKNQILTYGAGALAIFLIFSSLFGNKSQTQIEQAGQTQTVEVKTAEQTEKEKQLEKTQVNILTDANKEENRPILYGIIAVVILAVVFAFGKSNESVNSAMSMVFMIGAFLFIGYRFMQQPAFTIGESHLLFAGVGFLIAKDGLGVVFRNFKK